MNRNRYTERKVKRKKIRFFFSNRSMDVCMQTKVININAMSGVRFEIAGFFFLFGSFQRWVLFHIEYMSVLFIRPVFLLCDGITFPQCKFCLNCDKRRERLAKADFWSKCFANDVRFNIPFQLLFCSVEWPHESNPERAIHRSRMAQQHEHFQNTRWLSWFSFFVVFFPISLCVSLN